MAKVTLKEEPNGNDAVGVLSKIDHWACTAPGRLAYLDGERRKATYGELAKELGQRRAQLLSSNLSGKRIGIISEDPYELGLCVLAVAGVATAAPLATDQPVSLLRRVVKRLGLDALLVPSGVGPDLGIPQISFKDSQESAQWSQEYPALLLSTSGTTGAAKAVELSHANLGAATGGIGSVLELDEKDRAWGVMPLFHIHGLSALFATLWTGGSFLASGLPVGEQVPEILELHEPTWYSCSPALHQQILDSCGANPRHHLRFVRSASGPASAALIKRVEKSLQVPFVEAYGMTEAAPLISSNGLRSEDRKLGSVGRPSGTQIRIVDGEVQVKGPNVAHPDWLITGDLGYLDSDGFLFLTGRRKELINRGGEKILPREVEAQAALHPAVKEVAAFPLPDERWGEVVGLAIVLHSSLDQLEDPDLWELEKGLLGFLRRRLSPQSLPQSIEFLSELPSTPSGKRSRRLLMERHPRTDRFAELEVELTGLWREALGLSDIGPDDHFFHLGGHSLKALSMLYRLERRWGCKVSLGELLAHPTLRQCGELVRRKLTLSTPMSAGQEAIWIACQDDRLAPLYNVSASLRWRGEMEVSLLERAVEILLDSLPNVWISCRLLDGRPVFEVQEKERFKLSPEPFSPALLKEELSSPFDLAAGPMVRPRLFQESPTEYILSLVLHHLICDGWSAELIRAELVRIYGELAASREPRCQLTGSLAVGPTSERGDLHWRRLLKDFPTNRLGRARDLSKGRFERLEFRLSQADWSKCSALASRLEVTSYIYLMAALQMALSEETRCTDISVSSPLANRDATETGRVVGMFARVLPVRTRLQPYTSMEQAVEKVASAVSAALDYQDYPLHGLLKELGLPSPHSVLFAFQSHSEQTLYQVEELTAEPLGERVTGSKFSLSLYLSERGGELSGSWHFHSSTLSVSEVESLSRKFSDMLLSRRTKRSAEVDGFLQRWAGHVMRKPDALAAIEEGARWSYVRLDERSNQVAFYLRSKGVKADDLVALQLPRKVDFLVAVLGIWKAGAAYLPLSPEQLGRSETLSKEFKVDYLLDGPALSQALSRAPVSVNATPTVAETAYVMPTSGSTGRPKGVEITHSNLSSYLPALAGRLELREDDRYLHTAAFTFSSSVRQWMLPLYVGGTVVLAGDSTRRDPARLIEFARSTGASVVDLVPTHWRTVLSDERPILPQVRLALSASEPLSSDLAKRIVRSFPQAEVVAMYGQTETSGIVSTIKIDPGLLDEKIAPLGRPLDGVRLSILKEREEMVVEGPTVGRGYRHGRRFEGCYPTGDGVRLDQNGVWHFQGRLDRQLKVRGHRVEPTEVEEVLASHPAIRSAAVVLLDGRLHAYLEGDSLPSATVLREFLSERLADYQIPSTFSSVSELPRTDSGKLARSRLGVTEEESQLCQIWCEVLKLPEVEPEDNYFRLGGDSLLALQVVSRSEEAGIPVTLDQLFQLQTVRKICSALGGAAVEFVEDKGETVRVELTSLRQFCEAALRKAGLSSEGAAILSEVQIEQSLKGMPTHNVADIPRYVERLRKGLINKAPTMTVLRESRNSVLLNGDNGPGQWVATEAVSRAIKLAEENEVGMVAVRHSNHFGAAGHYAWLAAQQGLIALVTTNGPNILAPTGGVTPLFGNNPIAIGIPRQGSPPLLLDMALSVAPRGKIGLTVQEGRSLEPGWILDAAGRPTTDLHDLAAGLGVPIGDHKGYGLALMMEVLAGVWSGAEFGLGHSRERLKEQRQAADIGHFFLVMKVELLSDFQEFQARLSRLLKQIYSSDRAAGVRRIVVPGEIELESRAENLRLGVPIRASNYHLLREFAEREGLSHLWPGGRIGSPVHK